MFGYHTWPSTEPEFNCKIIWNLGEGTKHPTVADQGTYMGEGGPDKM